MQLRPLWLLMATLLLMAGCSSEGGNAVPVLSPTPTQRVIDDLAIDLGSSDAVYWEKVPTVVGGEAFPGTFWTGTEVVVLRTENMGNNITGERWNPTTNEVKRVTDPGLVWRAGSAMVWTGEEVLVVGGSNGPGLDQIGTAYNPTSDTWRPLSDPPGTVDGWSNSVGGPAVWTGSEMIIWRPGLAYQPATDSWRSIAESPLPPRNRPAIVWTGTELVVWGGCSPSDTEQCDEMNSGLLNDGARYNPDTDTWTELPTSPLIPAVHMVSGWTGSEMIIVVTDPGNRTGGTAATFDPEGLNWTLIDPPPLDSRRFAAAVWAGNQFVIWGGGNGASDKGAADGATYKPSTAEWSILPAGPGPGRALHSMIYTGDRLYISATRTASPPLQYHIDEFWPMDEASTHFDNAGPTKSVTAEVSPTQVGGVGFSFHPSTDRAEITSDRDGFIVCPAHIGGELETDGSGGSWGTRWLDGCITLNSGTVQLPATNGDQHVAIRILANDTGGREEATISMTWAPADGYLEYGVRRGTAQDPA